MYARFESVLAWLLGPAGGEDSGWPFEDPYLEHDDEHDDEPAREPPSEPGGELDVADGSGPVTWES